MCPKLPDSLSLFALLEREAGHETTLVLWCSSSAAINTDMVHFSINLLSFPVFPFSTVQIECTVLHVYLVLHSDGGEVWGGEGVHE